MDTRFWGPSGWKLLHSVATTYTPSPLHAVHYASFFKTIPYILPCKFCRASLTDYYREHPFALPNGTMDPSLDVEKWMYTIHNCVNNKLRKQGLHPAPNPPYPAVKTLYRTLCDCPWQQQMQTFWDFLFSVGYHHPREKRLYAEPMPDCPAPLRRSRRKASSCERNKWNLLSMKERTRWFRRFWSLLPEVLPPTVAEKWKRAELEHPPTLDTRDTTLSWLWAMRCALDADFKDPYASVCKQISRHASDCAHARGAFTCRRRRTRRRRTHKKTKQ